MAICDRAGAHKDRLYVGEAGTVADDRSKYMLAAKDPWRLVSKFCWPGPTSTASSAPDRLCEMEKIELPL